MSNVEALKALFVALGGDADDVADANTNAELIAALAGVLPESGAGILPDPSDLTDGDMLKVSGGKWVAYTPAP